MAKQFTPEFATHIDGEVLTLATCWLLVLRDGRQYGFTDLDVGFTIAGVAYTPAAGFSRSAEQSTSDLNPQSAQLRSILSAVGVNSRDLLSGTYDGATLTSFIVNYARLPASRSGPPYDYCPRVVSNLGEISTDGQSYDAQYIGRLEKYNQAAAELTSRLCRYQLGDSRCTVNLNNFNQACTVTALSQDRRIFTLSSPALQTANYYADGVLIFDSGLNAGNTYQVNAYESTRRIMLYEPPRRQVAIGDQVRVFAGCNKDLTACRVKFNNSINFGGEPHIPGWFALSSGKGTPGRIIPVINVPGLPGAGVEVEQPDNEA